MIGQFRQLFVVMVESKRALSAASQAIVSLKTTARSARISSGVKYVVMANEIKNETKYGRNWAVKAALCETCAYTGGYCLKSKMRFYKCKDYVKDEN